MGQGNKNPSCTRPPDCGPRTVDPAEAAVHPVPRALCSNSSHEPLCVSRRGTPPPRRGGASGHQHPRLLGRSWRDQRTDHSNRERASLGTLFLYHRRSPAPKRLGSPIYNSAATLKEVWKIKRARYLKRQRKITN